MFFSVVPSKYIFEIHTFFKVPPTYSGFSEGSREFWDFSEGRSPKCYQICFSEVTPNNVLNVWVYRKVP